MCGQCIGPSGKYGLGNTRMISHAVTVWACADAIVACKYLYNQSCVAYRALVSASTGYMCQVKPEMCHLTCTGIRGLYSGHGILPTGLLRAQNHRKPVSENYACSAFSHGVYGTCTGKKCQTIVQTRTACVFSWFWSLQNP